MDKVKNFFCKVGVAMKGFFKKAGIAIKNYFVSHDGQPSGLHNTLKKSAVQTILASVICAVVGLILGFIVLLVINPAHAWEGMTAMLKSFFRYDSSKLVVKNLGNMLVKASPIIMCGLAILFAYKAGLFNIGASGQYCMGAISALYAAFIWHAPWFVCILIAMIVGALWAAIAGALKAYCNVSEVISGIMLNWIGVYLTNIILSTTTKKYGVNGIIDPNYSSESFKIAKKAPQAHIPSLGLDQLFNNKYVTIAIILTVIVAIVVKIVLSKTTFGYELKATGINKHAAKYAGMKDKVNTIVTLAISGALAGLAAAFFYLSDYAVFKTLSAVPAAGFNGIAVSFLGGMDPIGTIVAGLFIQYITDSAAYLSTQYYNPQIADLIVSFIIYFCAFMMFIRQIMLARLKKSEDKLANKLLNAIGKEVK